MEVFVPDKETIRAWLLVQPLPASRASLRQGMLIVFSVLPSGIADQKERHLLELLDAVIADLVTTGDFEIQGDRSLPVMEIINRQQQG